MMAEIVSGTPLWVWGILLALVLFGTKQLMPRVTRLARVVRVALIMAAVSFYGVVFAFGASSVALVCWLGAAFAVAGLVMRGPLPDGTRYLPEKRIFELPGSWVPLVLMLGLFSVKFMVGVLASIHSPLAQTTLFGPLLGLVYGAFSGAFLGTAGQLMRLARQSGTSTVAATI